MVKFINLELSPALKKHLEFQEWVLKEYKKLLHFNKSRYDGK